MILLTIGRGSVVASRTGLIRVGSIKEVARRAAILSVVLSRLTLHTHQSLIHFCIILPTTTATMKFTLFSIAALCAPAVMGMAIRSSEESGTFTTTPTSRASPK